MIYGDIVGKLTRTARAVRLLVVLDYFQLLVVPAGVDAEDPDRWRVDFLAKLQRLGESYRSPMGATVLVVSEVRKGDRRQRELSMEDLLGSTRLNYAAHAVLLLQTPADDRSHGDVVSRGLRRLTRR